VKAGIFGGTFDPPHSGHLIVAQDAALALGLDRILFVPAAVPPHKQHLSLSPAAVRSRMLQLALEDDARFAVDLLELERSGPSYTVDTLRELTVRWPATQWTLLMGVDQYAELGTWREPEELRRLARIAVLSRSGLTGQTGAPTPAGDAHVSVTRIDISSTAIRERVAQGLPIRYLVPAAVERFIFEEGLYRRNGPVLRG
jgi:nicotinate-nucleotide adenylyltransferase